MTTPGTSLGTELLYSACWEDLATARKALRIPRGGVVVAVGAAGDNAIGLLLDDPRRIVAVDVNPAQTALVELKRAAVKTAPGEVAEFVGGIPSASGPDPARLDRYTRLRPQLSAEAVRYWDAHADEILNGVVHAGRFERYLAVFRRWLLPVVPGRDVVHEMLGARDIEDQRGIYHERWDSAAWRTVVRVFFSRRLLAAVGRHPAFFDQAPSGGVGAHYLARAAAGLTATPIRTNPYVTFILSGSYHLPEAAPEYLHPDHARLLAARAGRVEVVTRPLVDVLRDMPERSVDAFYLSDIFELTDPAAYAESLAEIARVGRPGARLCYWNNLVDRQRPDSLAERLLARTDLATELHGQDRAFLYSRLVVEEVRGVAAQRSIEEVSHAA